MTTWTPAAQQELDRHLERARPTLTASGADPAEVSDDLRRHLEAEASAASLRVITETDVRRLLAKIGAPGAGLEALPTLPQSPAPAATRPPLPRRKPGFWLLFGGVILPSITFAIELVTGMCAGAFFDPLPTFWHVLLVALVPVANGFAWAAVRRDDTRRRKLLSWANGAAFAVTCFYTLLFVPLLLPGIITIFFLGAGLLPLTPLLALIATVFLRQHLRRLGTEETEAPLPGFWRGIAAACLALALIESPVWMTRVAMHWAVAEDTAQQQRGLRWLRTLGNEDTLLRECYGRTRGAQEMDLAGWLTTGGEPVSPEQARELFYRVTGRPFNSLPAPRVRTGRGAFAELNEWTWDNDQGGERVGGRVRGLTLQSSRLDAVVESDAALAYTEWMLEFKNVSARQREARAQILLPPGGVVSRLTLWVNGEEREAAFAGRSHVRQAYRQVAIRQRRDPVLVTTAGPDRILMQCFPVPPEGGTLRVRIGITAPLNLVSPGEALLRWPAFLERNFTIQEDFRHSLWAECQGALKPAGDHLHAEQPKPGISAVRGQVKDADLDSAATQIRVARDVSVRRVWTRDPRSTAGGFVQASFAEATAATPPRIVLVLDGSRDMAGFGSELATLIERAPAGIEFAVLLATDTPAPLLPATTLDAAKAASLREKLADWQPAGGQDNVPALVQAWDLAAQKAGGVIVWVHGPQPVLLSSVDALRQAYERRPGGPVLHELQTAAGPNRVLENLDGVAAVRSVARLGSVADDLSRLLDSWRADRPQVRMTLEHTDKEPAAESSTHETSLHLARLWAASEVRRLQAARQVEPAVQLAAAYQVVTPISGAVVLETQAQYAQNDLQPAGPTTVPAIPEPGTWTLLLLGLVLVRCARKRAGRLVTGLASRPKASR